MNDTDLIPKNSRVYLKRIVKNVVPVKGGSIEVTRQEQEVNMILKMKGISNSTTTSTTQPTEEIKSTSNESDGSNSTAAATATVCEYKFISFF